MAKNNLSGGGSTNLIEPKFSHRRNNFPIFSKELLSARFGDVTPHFVFDTVVNDGVPFESNHQIQSPTLKSPLMCDFRMFKTYFNVPMNAILPRTWDLIFTNPVQGDDVPDDALCVIDNFKELISGLNNIVHFVPEEGESDPYSVSLRVHCFLMLENLLSYGGLPQYLRCNLRRYVSSVILDEDIISSTDADFGVALNSYFENGLSALLEDFDNLGGFTIYNADGDVVYSSGYLNAGDYSRTEFRHCIQLLRENPTYQLYGDLESYEAFSAWLQESEVSATGLDNYEPFNYSRLIAYQLGCAEFFTNEFIDPVYSALLYRDNAESIHHSISFGLSGHNYFFDYNGRNIQYDVFSGHNLGIICSSLTSGGLDNDGITQALAYLSLIFCFRRSLKKIDYFTSLKSRPLAVGSTTVPVVDSSVDAVDMTHRIQAQRFFNAVNRTGRKFGSYISGIFGGKVPPDNHDPHFLASVPYNVSGFEVENTGNDTGKRVTILKSSGGKFEFSLDVSIPSIIIGVTHFEVDRLYGDTTDRFFYYKDRYDMFNPFMQYIGDQKLYRSELLPHGNGAGDLIPFGYQARYQEYKQSFDHSSGVFCVDYGFDSYAPIESSGCPYISKFNDTNINPDFIRSYPSEFDRFYSAISGLGLATYFHFILSVYNRVNSKRQIEYRPNIL